jgi:hypothetical protein
MMIGFIGNEMVISNALVLCITNSKERLQPSITSIDINMVFFTRGSLSCHTKSLSMKHANALKSSTILIFIVIDLLHLIIIGKKNMVLSLKIGYDHFDHMIHQGIVSHCLLRLDVFVSQIFKMRGVDRNGLK